MERFGFRFRVKGLLGLEQLTALIHEVESLFNAPLLITSVEAQSAATSLDNIIYSVETVVVNPSLVLREQLRLFISSHQPGLVS